MLYRNSDGTERFQDSDHGDTRINHSKYFFLDAYVNVLCREALSLYYRIPELTAVAKIGISIYIYI